jgi:hypothetical protein|tara:strand:- start:1349 stop:1534 length:186 start_codon:yes stop_codon:yes gene_type:complete
MSDKGKPEAGKIYALTGRSGTPSIANGNTWKESEIKDEHDPNGLPLDFTDRYHLDEEDANV